VRGAQDAAPIVSFERRALTAAKITATPPAIDGDLGDEAWKTAPQAETFVDPQNGRTDVDQTVAYLLYDDKYIYVGFDCKDRDPAGIVGRETVRDSRYQGGGGGNEDNVEVFFDPFLSYRRDDLTRFSLNPLGTRSARIGGGRAGKTEWQGDWDGAAKRTADGWSAEMRIPWAILNYPSGKGPVTMGINFGRFQYRTKIGTQWSNTGPQGFMEREGRWTGVEIPKGAFRPKLSLLPYLLPGAYNDDGEVRSGVDARYTVTPELTVVSSINPDFATIEGAVEGIGFSRGERFIPERRPFFLEGNNYFNAGQGFAFGPYFYSRRITNFDLGTKVYGKVTPVDTIGILSTFDFGNRTDVVARWRRDLSPTADVGLFFTRKEASDPSRPDDLERNDRNQVAALLQNKRWGKFGIGSQWAFASGRDAGDQARQVNFTYEDSNNFTSFQLLDIGRRFRDANGLIFFNDFKGVSLYHELVPRVARRGAWRSFSVDFNPRYDWHQDGRPFRRGGGVEAFWETRSDYGIGFNLSHEKFDDQTDATWGIVLGAGQSNRFRRYRLRINRGKLGDKPYSFVGPSFSLRTLKKLDLIYDGGIQHLEGRQSQHVVTMNYEMSPIRSVGGRVVMQNSDTNWYLSYRNSGQKGTEAYFILGDPNARRFTRRAALKLVFAI
jgi:hypothetical protein